MNVGIVGTGTMAQGIARLLVTHATRTSVCGRSEASTRQFSTALQRWLERQVSRGKLTSEAAEESLGRISTHTGIAELSEADIVIEAVCEDLEVKRGIFAELQRVCADGALLATNTSSIPIRRISEGMESRGRVIGIHFMNPAYVMSLVEVVPAVWTAESVIDRTCHFLSELGKEAIVVPDVPGFVLNRILFASICEAIFVLEMGQADCATIDAVMKLGAGHSMGPLELSDFIGLDVCLAILEQLSAVEPERFQVPSALEEKVMQGKLGRKTGEGFYMYEQTPSAG